MDIKPEIKALSLSFNQEMGMWHGEINLADGTTENYMEPRLDVLMDVLCDRVFPSPGFLAK